MVKYHFTVEDPLDYLRRHTTLENIALMEPVDKKLVESLINQDDQAYEVLFDRYEAALYRFFYYSHGSHQTAEDQCGETFARFITAIKKINDQGSLKAFLFGVARHVLAEAFRKKRPIQEDACVLETMAGGKPSVFQEVSSRDELKWVLSIISQFEEPQRQILLLRCVENLQYDEIAGVMDMPLNSVKSHVHRGRGKLCKILAEKQSLNTGNKDHE